jgi:chemotaxis protein methyltransferase CheR
MQLRTEAADREMVGPNGEVGAMTDNIMALRRVG